MKKFVINLKRRPERLQQFHERCPYAYNEIEVIYGFDGKNPKNESKKEQKIYNSFKITAPIQHGVLGCTISHLRIWKQIVDQGIPMAMIFEDDAMFHDSFKLFMEKVTPILPTDGIVYFGGRFTPNFVIPEPFSSKVNDFLCKSEMKTWNAMFHERTTHGYIITLKLAKLFLLLFDFTKELVEIDKFMVQRCNFNNIPIYNTIPLLCHSPMGSESDIRH